MAKKRYGRKKDPKRVRAGKKAWRTRVRRHNRGRRRYRVGRRRVGPDHVRGKFSVRGRRDWWRCGTCGATGHDGRDGFAGLMRHRRVWHSHHSTWRDTVRHHGSRLHRTALR